MTSSRNSQHDIVLKIIYAYLVSAETQTPFNFELEVANLCMSDFPDVNNYIKLTSLKAIKYYPQIVEMILPRLTTWKYDRLPLLTRAILALAIAHYYYVGEVSKATVIDVAVSQAKVFLDSQDYKFVNAVLDGVLK